MMSPYGNIEMLKQEELERYESMATQEAHRYIKKLKSSKSAKQTKAIKKAKKQSRKRNRGIK